MRACGLFLSTLKHIDVYLLNHTYVLCSPTLVILKRTQSQNNFPFGQVPSTIFNLLIYRYLSIRWIKNIIIILGKKWKKIFHWIFFWADLLIYWGPYAQFCQRPYLHSHTKNLSMGRKYQMNERNQNSIMREFDCFFFSSYFLWNILFSLK